MLFPVTAKRAKRVSNRTNARHVRWELRRCLKQIMRDARAGFYYTNFTTLVKKELLIELLEDRGFDVKPMTKYTIRIKWTA